MGGSGYIIFYFIMAIVHGCIWGWASNKVVENKGYYENWFWWGFFFGLIAFIVALTKPEVHRDTYSSYTPMYGSAGTSPGNPPPRRAQSATDWECAFCHRINQQFTGTCACGHTKSESEEKRRKQREDSLAFATPAPQDQPKVTTPVNSTQEEAKTGIYDTEKEIVKAIREYRGLLEDGIISLDEFEQKKKQLLEKQ